MSSSTGPTNHHVGILCTTLRDGEQSPGVSLNTAEKLQIARQLVALNVDVIEAGYPATSPGDFEAVQAIARHEAIGQATPVISALARTHVGDIDAAWKAVRDAVYRRIHTYISTSDIHIIQMLESTRADVLGQARAAVAHAKQYVDDVEFSPQDATRTDIDFLAEVVQVAIDEGATTINIPDTVGYALPKEFEQLLGKLYQAVPDLHKVLLSVHCHDDLGLSVANSLAGVEAGARLVHCTMNGIGERAGNEPLEELVMMLDTRRSTLGYSTGIVTQEIARTSRLVSRLTGYAVAPNKAIVGRNAFAHEAGQHVAGVQKNAQTYEIMDPKSVGLSGNTIVLGKHSGRHAVSQALREMGFDVQGAALETIFRRFKEVADRKKQVTAMDLEALVSNQLRQDQAGYELVWLVVVTRSGSVPESSPIQPRARVGVMVPEFGMMEVSSLTGDGPYDMLFDALNQATSHPETKLVEFKVGAITEGQDALGDVLIVVEVNGQRGTGRGLDTNVMEAAAQAYLQALSRAVLSVETTETELAVSAP